VLAICGDEDRTLRAEHFLPLFEAALPDGVMRRLPRAGHFSPQDAPMDVAHLIIQFMGGER
jgi:haloalkane dehalogenase